MVTMLTKQERERFVSWLEDEAESDKMLLKQLAKFPGHERFAEVKKQRIGACLIVASLLRSIEDC